MNNLPLTNIFNEGRNIVLFYRIGKTLSIQNEKSFFPYYYNPSVTGVFRGYFGAKYNKIICREPWQIPKERQSDSAEADIIYTKRFMIDKLNITKADLRYVFYDIETKSKDFPDPLYAPDPITCITAYDNYTQKYTTFWTKDYATEYLLIKAFVDYIKVTQPDLMMGWNALGFDYPYLCNRYPNFSEEISPIGKLVKRNNFPAGIAVIDYMDWIKKIYKYKKYSLEYVYCDTFKLPYEPKKYEFGEVTEDIKIKNIADVRKMVELEEKLKAIPYFDELRRLSKTLWEDLTHYSILVDGFIIQIAKEKGYILPTKPDEFEKAKRAEDDIVGGYVYCKPGLYENVHLFDVGGTYPNLIRTFNLDPVNVRKEPNGETTTIRKVHVAQNANAIIPTICAKLISSRREIQQQLETVKGEEADLLKKKDEAHKALNNSVYGITLFKSSRLYNKDIAETITYLARLLIRFTKWTLGTQGINVIASDTDSIFVDSKESYQTIAKIINEEIIPKYLKRFGKSEGTLFFKYEGTYKNLLMLVKKHYKGTLIKPNGEIKEVNKGIEAVRSDSSKFMEKFQEDLINKILNKETKESIIVWIKTEVERFKTLPLIDIAFPVKLSKPIESYKTESINVRALRYAQADNPDWQVRIGQDYFYTYIIPEKDEIVKGNKKHKKTKKQLEENPSAELYETLVVDIKKPIDVYAFDEFSTINFKVDYEQMLERNVYMKCEAIFESLNWSMDEIR
jgi:DNA polymerase elongation subunit (family B)